MNDCIAAISTPPGEGGIAIVRLSGADSIAVADKIFEARSGRRIREVKSHSLNLGWIKDETGQIIDEVLVGKMEGPRSYTGEDVVEINCHGGAMATRRCLEMALQAGARPAEPGEFTKRAFLNGRLDMAQAEAVIELIRARSKRALVLSLNNLKGLLSRNLNAVEESLILVNSRLEGSIDFPEEVGDPDWEEIERNLTAAETRLKGLAAGSKRAGIYRDGVKVVIAGKPNVGKSSLLNVLLQKERAIVTEIPGTTRDVIEDLIYIRGIPVRVMDTAGIRTSQDAIEIIGMEKTREAIREAEIVLFMLDAAAGISPQDQEIMREIEDKPRLIVLNKEDVEDRVLNREAVKGMFPGVALLEVSALKETGIEELENCLEQMIIGDLGAAEEGQEIMANVRQERAIIAVLEHVQDALAGVRNRTALDAIAVDTWGAISWIEELTGKAIRADVMAKIFADFCIGK